MPCISSALLPRPSLPSSQPVGTSPAKVVESRSKCYKQLNDLNQLKASGIISEAEYTEEKESVMSVLRIRSLITDLLKTSYTEQWY